MDWSQILGLAINGVGVLMVVQALKNYVMPWLTMTYPWALPILALGAGSAMTWATLLLTDLVGAPIDLSAITGILTGAMAVVGYGVARQTPFIRQRKFVIPKRGGGFRGSSLLICFLVSAFLFLLSGPLFAQGYDKKRGREKPEDEKVAAQPPEEEEKITFQFSTIAIGFGSFFDNEGVTFSTAALYGALQWHGIGLPIIKEGSSTGIMLEGHVAQILGQEEFGYSMRVQDLTTVDYRIWSITRVPISAIPLNMLQAGSVSRMYTGVDVLLTEGGSGRPLPEDRPDVFSDWTGDFDQRFVIGGDLGILGPGNLAFEIYSFQDDLPFAFAFFYGF